MQIKNTQSWAGESFSYAPGDIVEVDDATAIARIAAGLAEAVGEPAEEPAPRRRARREAV